MHIFGDFILGLIKLFAAPMILFAVVFLMLGRQVDPHFLVIHTLRLIKHTVHYLLKLVEAFADSVSHLLAKAMTSHIKEAKERKSSCDELEYAFKKTIVASVCMFSVLWILHSVERPADYDYVFNEQQEQILLHQCPMVERRMR